MNHQDSILLIDNAPTYLPELREGLKHRELQIRVITESDSALSEIETYPPDLILLRVDTVGMALGQRLKGYPPTAATPIIALGTNLTSVGAAGDWAAEVLSLPLVMDTAIVRIETQLILRQVQQQLQQTQTELQAQATHRRNAEAALAKEYRLFRSIIDMLPIHIYLKDQEGHYLAANLARAKFMGVDSPKMLIGQTDFDFFTRQQAGQHHLTEQKIIQSGHPLLDYQEISVNQETQQPTWLSTTKIPLTDDEGLFIGLLSLDQDITAQKQAQEALQTSEAQYRTLISAMPDLIFRNKSDGTYLDYHAPSPERLFVPPEQFIGRRLAEIFPPEVAEMGMKYIELALQTGETQHYEYPMHVVVPPEYYEARIVPSGDDEVLTIVRDITDRKRAEEKLKQRHQEISALASENARLLKEEHRHREIAESLREVTIALSSSLDQKTLMVRILEQLGRVITYDTAAVFLKEGDELILTHAMNMPTTYLGKKISLSGNNPTARVAIDKKVAILADVSTDPDWVVWPDDYVCSWMGAPLLVGETVLGVLIINSFKVDTYHAEDAQIIETFTHHAVVALENVRLYAETIQRANELSRLYLAAQEMATTMNRAELLVQIIRHLTEALNATSGYIMEVDLAQETLVVVAEYWSDTALEREQKSDLGQVYAMSDYPTSRRSILQNQIISIDHHSGEDETQEYHNLIKYGIKSALLVPIVLGGQVLGQAEIWESHRDRTFSLIEKSLAQTLAQHAATVIQNVKLFDETQEAKKAAEQANQAKSVFLANMSHELRTPLNAILGYAQILKRDNALSPRQKQAVTTVEQNGEHLLTLLSDILDLSKIEAGKMELSPNSFHLPAFIEELNDMFRSRAEQKNIQFTCLPHDNLPLEIWADKIRLRQILINLLSNAIKFTQQGRVTFTVEALHTTPQPDAPDITKLRFTVEDTGIGIHPHDLPTIFAPFQQGGDSFTPNEGTGLGLSISKRLVELMGGYLDVTSIPDQGSTFWVEVTVPASKLTPNIAEPETQEIVGYQGPCQRALIVDDNWDNRQILVDILESLGFTVEEAENGQEAVDKATNNHPDIIFMDLIMPVMDGLTAIRQIRLHEAERSSANSIDQTKSKSIIIAISASAFAKTLEQSMQAGCNAFLAKPFLADDLLKQLQTHLSLNWIYRQPPQETTVVSSDKNDPILPPMEKLETLFEMTLKGNISGIERELQQLEQTDSRYQPFVDELYQLTQQFKTRQLRQLLKSLIESQ